MLILEFDINHQIITPDMSEPMEVIIRCKLSHVFAENKLTITSLGIYEPNSYFMNDLSLMISRLLPKQFMEIETLALLEANNVVNRAYIEC